MFAAQHDVPVRHEGLKALIEARTQTDRLFALVRRESLYNRPIPERHRIIFYIGHLEAFDWNLLRGLIPQLHPFHPEFDRLFAFGIDPVGAGLPTDQPEDWPALTEVQRYTDRIREMLDAALKRPAFWHSNCDGFAAGTLVSVAIEHRLMHAETLAYMFHQLPLEQKIFRGSAHAHESRPVDHGMVEIPAGVATLGLARRSRAFGWDNEYDAHTVSVPVFAIDRYMVSNGQYLEFVDSGAYENRSLWTEAGWNWKTERNITNPAFWRRHNGDWHYRTMFEELSLPLDWPVYVSHAEATAYARWAGKNLPSEAQWHRAAYGAADDSERAYPWGWESPDRTRGNFGFRSWDPAPVNAFPRGASAFGVEGLVGNGWEWTSSVFGPFEGFQPFPFYPGYSTDFFDGLHYVLKGGSARTDACMLRRSFRNWFQPQYPYIYAGFRCVAE